jgi:hypothetical protein
MMRFVFLQSAAHKGNEAVVHRLHESVDLTELATQLSRAATTGEVVEVRTVVGELVNPVALYIRPAAWAVWWLLELSETEIDDVQAKKNKGQIAQLAGLAAIAQLLTRRNPPAAPASE